MSLANNQAAFSADGVGVSYSWGMESMGAFPNAGAPVGSFDATLLNVNQWLDAAVAARAKYALLTVQHASGFVLTATTTTTYNSTNAGCVKPRDVYSDFYA